MPTHDPIKILITLGFGSLLTLMSVLAYISLSQMDSTIDKMATLVDETNAKSSAANLMRDSARLRGTALTKMYISDDPFERELQRLKMSEYGLRYRQAFDVFLRYKLSSRELKLISEIRVVTAVARQANNNAAEALLIKQDIRQALDDFALANSRREKVLSALDKLIELQNRNAHVALQDSVDFHRNTQSLIIIIAAIAFFVGTLISLLVVRETTKKNTAIRFQASHDALTNLVNRGEFEQRLKQALAMAYERNIDHALCYLDLDQFKIINDTCGHKAGDELLKQITQVILRHVRDRDTLGRLGGDEFGLLLENCSLENALEICEGIVTVVKKHEFFWNERCYHVGVSIGVIAITADTKSIATSMSEADMACYAAKDMGRNQVHIHESEGRHVRRMHKELSWVADIGNTIEENRFLLYAQPIVPTNGEAKLNIFEVLLRIKDDNGEVVSPGQYLPAAERFSLMREVDIWVTKNAIRFLSEKYQQQPDIKLRLFINLSGNSISDTTFCTHIHECLEKYPVPKHSICFEVTETAAVKNIEQAITIINDLKQYDCLFALDDFGSGTSSLTYLKNLPVDYLKIDGSIVQNINTDRVNRAMVAAVNEIGRVMEIETIAEYIENAEVFDHIKRLGVTYGQGYYISKPCPIEDLRMDWPNSNLHRL
jgi:diguanylate cyclase (GGDEF)-like protein